MKGRSQLVEAVLFLPAMVLLAGAVFAIFWLIIKFGNTVLHGWFWLLAGIGLPRPAALAVGVLLAAVTVPLTVRFLARRAP